MSNFSLINCPACGKEASQKAKACPNCGQPFLKGMNLAWLIPIIIGLFLLAYLYKFMAGR